MLADQHPPAPRFEPRGTASTRSSTPGFIEMQRLGFSRFGFAAMSHREGVLGWPGRVPHVVKYALSYIFVQGEFGLFCPISMTDSAARVLNLYGPDELRQRYVPGLTSTDMSTLIQSAQLLTERTGGSDVGANECVARFEDGQWRLWGEKWFCSNAGAEVHLTLARPNARPGHQGLGCSSTRTLPDGSRNSYLIRRLKDKLGRSPCRPASTSSTRSWLPVVIIASGFAQMAE